MPSNHIRADIIKIVTQDPGTPPGSFPYPSHDTPNAIQPYTS
uniref:Uncharacterized protein n=1 Tax=Myoviridae sp. ctCpP1 TaxID=2825054 RepID=A0A8S5V7L8_9CAUD|nr:MAG TPA: hypothetical protein [Myoviridae sp. ctCpP1]